MSDIIHNKEELMEVVREAADAVFDAWIRLKEKEEKKREQPVVMSVEQMKRVNRVMEDMGCPPAIPWVDQIEEKKMIRGELLRAKRRIEKTGAEVKYRAEKVEEGHYRIFVDVFEGGTDAMSRSQTSCSTNGEAFKRA